MFEPMLTHLFLVQTTHAVGNKYIPDYSFVFKTKHLVILTSNTREHLDSAAIRY
jgi:hypothetical protein